MHCSPHSQLSAKFVRGYKITEALLTLAIKQSQARRMWLSEPILLMISVSLSNIVCLPYGESFKHHDRDLVYFEYESQDMDNSALSGWVNTRIVRESARESL